MPLSCTRPRSPRSPRSPREAGSDGSLRPETRLWWEVLYKSNMATNEALYLVQAQKWIAKLDRTQAARTLFFVDSKHFQFWSSFSDCILLWFFNLLFSKWVGNWPPDPPVHLVNFSTSWTDVQRWGGCWRELAPQLWPAGPRQLSGPWQGCYCRRGSVWGAVPDSDFGQQLLSICFCLWLTAIDGHGKHIYIYISYTYIYIYIHIYIYIYISIYIYRELHETPCSLRRELKNLVLTCLDLLEQFVKPWIPLTGTDLGRDGFAGCTLCTSPSQLVLGSQRPQHASIAATCLGSTEGRARKPTGIRNAYNGPTSLKAFCFEVLVRISICTFWDSAHFGYKHFLRRWLLSTRTRLLWEHTMIPMIPGCICTWDLNVRLSHLLVSRWQPLACRTATSAGRHLSASLLDEVADAAAWSFNLSLLGKDSHRSCWSHQSLSSVPPVPLEKLAQFIENQHVFFDWVEMITSLGWLSTNTPRKSGAWPVQEIGPARRTASMWEQLNDWVCQKMGRTPKVVISMGEWWS